MATIKFNEQKNQLQSVIIKGATLMYTKVKKAYPVYAQKDLPTSKQDQFEYTVDLVVDEDVADQFDEKFPKQSSKKLLKSAFMKQYKIEKEEDFPESLDKKAKKFFVIKVKQNTHYVDRKTGKVTALSPETRPRAVLVEEDGKTDITLSKEIGNGSVGDVLLCVVPNKQYGDSAKLKGILVTSLVEYEGGSGSDADMEDFFGSDVEFAELPETPETTQGKQSNEDAPFDTDDEDVFEDELPDFDDEDEYN